MNAVRSMTRKVSIMLLILITAGLFALFFEYLFDKGIKSHPNTEVEAFWSPGFGK